MRKPAYISPSAFSLYCKSPEDYYLQYLSDIKISRPAQLQVMSIGSSFDAFVKSFLYNSLFGKKDPKYDFQALFEAQVEPHNRDWALSNGQYVFDCYMKTGALNLLLLDLQKSVTEPRFEIEIMGAVNSDKVPKVREMKDVVLLGKPDVLYRNKEACPVILDFKVNGYLSQYKMSPAKGYIKLLDSNGYDLGKHSDAVYVNHKGTIINATHKIEDVNTDWAHQLIIYGWLIGVDVGDDIILAIDQILCHADPLGMGKPKIKVAQHRCRTARQFQIQLFEQLQDLWNIIHEEPFHYFKDLSLEESQRKCSVLDKQARDLAGLGTAQDKWFAKMAFD